MGKFKDPKRSGKIIRRISDQLCLEHGLSVIENPKPSRGHYGTWKKEQSELKSSTEFNLLIDIQAKIQKGKGGGFEHWARLFNLKEAAKTLIFLQENKLTSYEKLEGAANGAVKNFNGLSVEIKNKEARLKEISVLQYQISHYSRTREVYQQYKKSGWSKKFLAQHEDDIILHKVARKYFDEAGFSKNNKLPTMQSLKQEYAILLKEKNKLYSDYKSAKENMIKLKMAKQNADTILNIKPTIKPQKKSYEMSL